MSKLQIKTLYFLGMPRHTILDEQGIKLVQISGRNYKLACKIRKLLEENPSLLERTDHKPLW